MQKKYAIIVAGGYGSRMRDNLPKQFHALNGKPVLMHTIEKFAQSVSSPTIIVVLNKAMITIWEEFCRTHFFKIPHTVVFGGDTRFQSVKNGLLEINKKEYEKMEDVLIAIHDAARPLISNELIDRCYDTTAQIGATVLAVPSVDSIRLGTIDKNEAVDRNRVWMVQTPQTFRGSILMDAFQQEESPTFTDDASVVEKLGYPIHLIEGDYKNIKITYPDDIKIAQFFLTSVSIS